MSSKTFKLIIDRPTHEKNWILDIVFLPSDYVIGNATIFGPDSYVDIADHFLIKIQLPLQGDKSLTQLTIERKNLDRTSTDNPTIDLIQIMEDRTKLIIKSHLNKVDIQAPKERKIVIPNKHLLSSTETTICKRKGGEQRRSVHK